MTLFTLCLVLASAALHASWNLWAKQIRSAARGGAIAWMVTVLGALFYAPVAWFMFAHGSWRPTSSVLIWIAASSVLHVIYFLVLLRGYRVSDLSVVYPTARGTGPLCAAIGGVLILGERPTLLSSTGLALIVTAIAILATGAASGSGRERRMGLVYGLITGLMIGTYTLWDSWAVKRLGVPALLYYWLSEAIRTVLYAPMAYRDRAGIARLWRSHRTRVIAIAALAPFSYILMLLALSRGAVSHIAPAREIGILFGAWLGGQFLGEGERARRFAAAAAFVAGVTALALS